MKVGFIIQSEGRGHQTQALSLADILTKNGIEISFALLGTSGFVNKTSLLDNNPYFEFIYFKSPSLAYNPKTKSLSICRTLRNSFFSINDYLKSLKKIRQIINSNPPDVIINFYDFLGGIYSGFLNQKDIPVFCVGHQYLLRNKLFKHPQGHLFDRIIVNFNTYITSLGSSKMLALSFNNFPSNGKIITVPPLLRPGIKQLEIGNGNFYLVYLTQEELLQEIVEQIISFPNEHFVVFANNTKNIYLPRNVEIKKIANNDFLQAMAHCKALICTAGFESVCEAMYLGKPVFMLPIKKHYEQLCNAIDGQRSGAGLYEDNFNLTHFLNYLAQNNVNMEKNRRWINKAEEVFLTHIFKYL